MESAWNKSELTASPKLAAAGPFRTQGAAPTASLQTAADFDLFVELDTFTRLDLDANAQLDYEELGQFVRPVQIDASPYKS